MRITFCAILFLGVSTLHGQTLNEILKQAETNYPLLKAKHFEVHAAENGLSSAKMAAVPSIDAAYQINYATHNNITGMASSQFFVPISGPPSVDNSYEPVYGSSASLLMNWEIFTFGQRTSRIDVAKANLQLAEADASHETFRHKINVIEAYFDVILGKELSKVYQKNLERSNENYIEVETLTRTGLRPAVDTAVLRAEISRAKIELLTHEKHLQTQLLNLSELLANDNISYHFDSGYFHYLPVDPDDTANVSHPLLALSKARAKIQEEHRRSVQRSIRPTLSFWGTAYARGSGIRYDGEVNSNEGLHFTRYNYGFGLQLSVPLLRFIAVRNELNEQTNLLDAQQERNRQIEVQLSTKTKIASLNLTNAVAIAREGPAFYNSAKFSFDALQARYNAGLANHVDLLQAQYALLKAESDLKKSYLEAWRALLYLAVVKGDLNLFLNQLPEN